MMTSFVDLDTTGSKVEPGLPHGSAVGGPKVALAFSRRGTVSTDRLTGAIKQRSHGSGPEPNGSVVTCGREQFAIRTPGNLADDVGVAGQVPQQGAMRWVPKLNMAIAGGGSQRLPSRTPRHTFNAA